MSHVNLLEQEQCSVLSTKGYIQLYSGSILALSVECTASSQDILGSIPAQSASFPSY